MARPDYGRSRWYGAHSNGYSSASRPGSNNINKIIVHITQGSWSSAINWFNDSRSQVSAHYVVRSDDGFIGQCVQEKDISYHAGDWPVNQTSIGIEHEGYGNDPGWLTNNLYNSSAKLAAYLANKYNIPIDRNHFLGHKQVSSTACPGNYWDWEKYLKLVRNYANPQYQQWVDNGTHPHRFWASNAWGTSSYNSEGFRKNYKFARPRQVDDQAMFKVRFPRRGKYRIWARWPSDPGYNPRTRFHIFTANGWEIRVRNQRVNGGRWVILGDFTMKAGDGYWIRIGRRTPNAGYVIADAVLVREM